MSAIELSEAARLGMSAGFFTQVDRRRGRVLIPLELIPRPPPRDRVIFWAVFRDREDRKLSDQVAHIASRDGAILWEAP